MSRPYVTRNVDNDYMRSKARTAAELVVAYDGGWPVCVGTFEDVAEFWGVTVQTARWYSYPSRRRLGRCVVRTGVDE